MDGRQLGQLASGGPCLGGIGAGQGAGSWRTGAPSHSRLSPGASLQAGPDAVLGASRRGHPSRPSSLTPPVASAVLQPHLGPQSRPVPGAAAPLAQHVKSSMQAKCIPAAALTWAECFISLMFLLLIPTNGFLFK